MKVTLKTKIENQKNISISFFYFRLIFLRWFSLKLLSISYFWKNHFVYSIIIHSYFRIPLFVWRLFYTFYSFSGVFCVWDTSKRNLTLLSKDFILCHKMLKDILRFSVHLVSKSIGLKRILQVSNLTRMYQLWLKVKWSPLDLIFQVNSVRQ